MRQEGAKGLQIWASEELDKEVAIIQRPNDNAHKIELAWESLQSIRSGVFRPNDVDVVVANVLLLIGAQRIGFQVGHHRDCVEHHLNHLILVQQQVSAICIRGFVQPTSVVHGSFQRNQRSQLVQKLSISGTTSRIRQDLFGFALSFANIYQSHLVCFGSCNVIQDGYRAFQRLLLLELFRCICGVGNTVELPENEAGMNGDGANVSETGRCCQGGGR